VGVALMAPARATQQEPTAARQVTSRTISRSLVAVALVGVVLLPTNVGAAGTCPAFLSPVEAGRITDQRLDEVSGLAAVRTVRRALWLHEDSGNGPWLFAVTSQGDLRASIEVLGATNRDWEDMARARGRLWIGDIGDNGRSRSEIQVYWFTEPSSLGIDSVTARVVTLRYPDDAHDAEAMIVDGRNRRLFIFEKQTSSATSRVYGADLRGVQSGDTLRLRLVARVPLMSITAADLGRDGIIVRDYTSGLLFPWTMGRVVPTLRRSTPCPVELPTSESIAFSISGQRMYSIREGSDPSIRYVRLSYG